MKAAIIGYGQIGPVYHQALASNKIEVLLCDLNSLIYPQDFRSKAFQEVDFIVVSTPPHTHLEIASYFLCQGKKVILEKPAVLNLTELIQLQHLADDQPGCLYLSYHTAFNPLLSQLVNDLEQARPQLEKISIKYQENVFDYHPNFSDWIFRPELSGGGCMIDSGINIFSVLGILVAKPTKLVKASLKYKEKMEVEIQADIQMMAGRTPILISLDWMSNQEIREYIILTNRGEFRADLARNYLVTPQRQMYLKSPTGVDQEAEYRELVKDALNYFQTGKTLIADFWHPLKSVFEVYDWKT